MLDEMRWVISDSPHDWFEAATVVIGVAMFVVTAMYVIFTYRLMRSTAQTAQLAFQQTQAERFRKWLPIAIAVDEAQREVSAWMDKHYREEWPQFIAQPQNRDERFRMLLQQVLPSAMELSSPLYLLLAGAAAKMAQANQLVLDIWPLESGREFESERQFRIARERVHVAGIELQQAKLIIDPVIDSLRRTVGEASFFGLTR